MLAFASLFVVGYAFLASRAARRGSGPLGAAAAAALLVFLALVITVGVLFQVPSMVRLLVYALTLVGPALLLPAALLWRHADGASPAGGSVGVAIAGALVGLAMGWVLVIYVLRVW